MVCFLTYISVCLFSCSAAVGIGFYGNSETNDGVYQLIYALDNANRTLSGIDSLVRNVMTWVDRFLPSSSASTVVLVLEICGEPEAGSSCPQRAKKSIDISFPLLPLHLWLVHSGTSVLLPPECSGCPWFSILCMFWVEKMGDFLGGGGGRVGNSHDTKTRGMVLPISPAFSVVIKAILSITVLALWSQLVINCGSTIFSSPRNDGSQVLPHMLSWYTWTHGMHMQPA